MDFHVPDHVTQRTGSQCQFSLCWGAVGAWEAAAASGSTVKVTPEEFARKAGGGSGAPNPATGCKTGFERDLQRGLNNLGLDNDLFMIPFADFRDRMSRPRREVFAVAVDYEKWPAEKDCMNGSAVDVNHMVGYICGVDDKGRIRVMNPLCDDYQLVRLSELQVAASSFARARSREGILVSRVARPKIAGLPADKARIADLEDLVERQGDYIATARRTFQDGLELPVPQ
jgi:hypothetical protein